MFDRRGIAIGDSDDVSPRTSQAGYNRWWAPACRVVAHLSHEKQAADEEAVAEYQFGGDRG